MHRQGALPLGSTRKTLTLGATTACAIEVSPDEFWRRNELPLVASRHDFSHTAIYCTTNARIPRAQERERTNENERGQPTQRRKYYVYGTHVCAFVRHSYAMIRTRPEQQMQYEGRYKTCKERAPLLRGRSRGVKITRPNSSTAERPLPENQSKQPSQHADTTNDQNTNTRRKLPLYGKGDSRPSLPPPSNHVSLSTIKRFYTIDQYNGNPNTS